MMLITHVGCLLNFDPLAGTSRTEPPMANTSASTASLVDTNTHETYLLRQLHTCNELSCIVVPGRLLLYMRLILFCFWAGRNPDSHPPANALQRLIQFVHTGYQWTGTAEAIMCSFFHYFVKVLIVLGAVHVQISLYIHRAAATHHLPERRSLLLRREWHLLRHMSLSLVWVAWYVGNGMSNGNPYGTAAVFGVVVSPLIFLWVFALERYLAGNIMCCAMFALVVCFHDHT
ncbi:hypothetical protein DFH09DRAFT_36278 [Mycena vulgaris]|nr:hypothetical protein DFH09DRAFT_36278 [Mycena vulgaris]